MTDPQNAPDPVLAKEVRDLAEQLQVGDFRDRHGHPAANLIPLRNLLAISRGDPAPHAAVDLVEVYTRAQP